MAKKSKILIIEDEKLLLDVLKKKFISKGFSVLSASDGNEGWKAIEKKPDLILLDMMLPGLNGYEILEKMKENSINIPVLIVSNSGQPVDIKKAYNLGACDFLVKSKFEMEEVVEKAKHCILLKCNKYHCTMKGPRIMLVEDDRFLRELCVKKLLSEGFCVDISLEGDEAYDKIRCIKPDLVLLDIIMPGMSGFNVLEKIRKDENKEIANIPIIMLSNLGQDNDIKKAKELGANDFVIKANLDLETLGDKVRDYLKSFKKSIK